MNIPKIFNFDNPKLSEEFSKLTSLQRSMIDRWNKPVKINDYSCYTRQTGVTTAMLFDASFHALLNKTNIFVLSPTHKTSIILSECFINTFEHKNILSMFKKEYVEFKTGGRLMFTSCNNFGNKIRGHSINRIYIDRKSECELPLDFYESVLPAFDWEKSSKIIMTDTR